MSRPGDLDGHRTHRVRAPRRPELDALLVAQLAPGTLFARRYLVQERLGRGATGRVVRVLDQELREEVALKILDPSLGRDEHGLDRFRREVKLARKINHPNVCRVFDLGEADGQRFLTMEFIAGPSLRTVMDGGQLDLRAQIRVLGDLAAALDCAHAHAIVHRDLKPENVMLRANGQAVVVDFGLARARSDEAETNVAGTPAYMSPEQIRGAVLDHRSDIFALGIIAFELLSARLPFYGDSDDRMMRSIEHDSPLPLQIDGLPDSVLTRLEDALRRALEKHPEERYEGAGQFVHDLGSALDGLDTQSRVRARLRPGDLVGGKYRIERLLGRGGMGLVFSAVHVGLEERVAIKVLSPRFAAEPKILERFVREARATAKIKSEHAVGVTDIDVLESGVPYIVMEFLLGEDLAQLVQRRGPIDVPEAIGYVVQACDAIAEAHSYGIVHRDLKPSNVFVTQRRDGTPHVKVLDFGISKLSYAMASLTDTRDIMGTPRYMPPEQLSSSRDVDARADVWSLGAILHFLLTGAPPYDAADVVDLVALMGQPPAMLAALQRKLPAAVADAIARCLASDPSARFANAAELRSALVETSRPLRAPSMTVRPPHEAVSADADTERVAASGYELARATVRRRMIRRVAGVVALLAIAAAGGGGVSWLAARESTQSPAPSTSIAAESSAAPTAAEAPPAAAPVAEPAPTEEPPASHVADATRSAPAPHSHAQPAPSRAPTAEPARRPPPSAEYDPFGGKRR